jgi:hypothetical protein
MMTGLDAHTLKNDLKPDIQQGLIGQFGVKTILFHFSLFIEGLNPSQWMFSKFDALTSLIDCEITIWVTKGVVHA